MLFGIGPVDEPTAKQLREIVAEEPLIRAELRVVEAEIAIAQIDETSGSGRRLRLRAEAEKTAALMMVENLTAQNALIGGMPHSGKSVAARFLPDLDGAA